MNVASALERRKAMIIARDHQKLLEALVESRTAQIRHREEEVVLRLAWAAESHDKSTGDHVRRIGVQSGMLAEALGWESRRVDDIRVAAIMHDIGKIAIADGILLKTDRLTPQEFEVAKQHTEIGASILDASEIPLLQMAKEIALCHHEKWDGSGYPRGLAGEAIPESARIVAVVDVYDALTHARVYGPAIPEEEALAIMQAGREKHFDPRILDRFIELIPEIHRIRDSIAQRGRHRDDAEEETFTELEAIFPTHSFSRTESPLNRISRKEP